MAHFEAGDYVFLNVPAVSLLEWHPFTISSSPQEHSDSGELTLHILALDDAPDSFTARVADWAKQEAPQVTLTNGHCNVHSPALKRKND